MLTSAKQHASTKWLTVAPPYIPDTVVPAPHMGFVLGDGLGHAVWQAVELYRNPEARTL
jgi:hypothetical protein